MSGTSVKVTGFICTSGSSVATGATLAFRWNLYPSSVGATELQLQASTDNGATWQSWHRVPATATTTTKGGAPNALYSIRLVARRSTGEIAGSASDPVTVRVGPAPVTTPTPTVESRLAAVEARLPPVEKQAADTAAALAALKAQVGNLASRVAALEAASANVVAPADLRRVGASTAAEEIVVVRAGEIVVATRG